MHFAPRILSVTDGVWVDHADCAGTERALREAVRSAQRELLRIDGDRLGVNRVLTALLAEVAPVYERLESLAEAQPAGPVASALTYVRLAVRCAARGEPDLAATSVGVAAAMTRRIA